MAALKTYLLNLNLFAPPDGSNTPEDDQRRRSNIIATRIYLFLLIFILIGVGVVLSLIVETTIITVIHPTREQFERLPINAKCPCSQISIPFGKFTSLEARFHQVCSSDFVSDRWLRAINSGANSTYFFGTDFRTLGSAQFQALAGFCRLSQAAVEQSISSFNYSTLVSAEVLADSILQSQTQASIGQFQSAAPNTFRSQLRLINQMTVNNRLISGLGTNTIHTYYISTSNTLVIWTTTINYLQNDGSWCRCDVDICDTISSSNIVNIFGAASPLTTGDVQWMIPGISAGCLPVTSMLVSTLECFYNQICVDTLISYLPTHETFTAMTIADESRYNPTSTVQSIVDNLMIENWTIHISYSDYYSQCAPLSCTYFTVSRHDVVFVLTKVINLLSGMALILRIVVPLVVRLIRRLRNPTATPPILLCGRFDQMKAFIWKTIVELNLFKHYPATDRQIRHQRFVTWLYIVLIVNSLSLLVTYTSLDRSLQSRTILHPPLPQYIQLQQDYPQTLSCPCTLVTQSYSTFITIQPELHQVCFSDLVSEKWISYIQQSSTNQQALSTFDYRVTAPSQFQSLSMFCQQAEQTIDDALRVLFAREFVSAEVVSQESFEVQVNSLIEDWKSATLNTFMRTIQLVRATTQGNQLFNIFNSLPGTNIITRKPTITALTYSNCSCALSASCYDTVSIYNIDQYSRQYTKVYTIPNFFTGCYPIESLLASTLECYYNISCMLEIDSYLSSPEPFTFSALDPDLNHPNETIESIVNGLMVDTWSSNWSFAAYYNACTPSSCTYRYVDRSNLLVIIATIAGIFGGVSLGFKLILIFALRFIDNIIINGFSRLTIVNVIRHMFSCVTERQIIHRLHIVLLITTLFVLYICSAFTSQTVSVEVDKPSLSIYQDLLAQSYNSLECPCSQISIKYKSFLNIQSRFHEVCSTDFVSDQWIAYLYADGDSVYRYSSNDFLYSASGQFQLLASFCRLSEETVDDALLQLGASDFINTQLLSSSSLYDRIRTIVSEFQQTMPQSFVNTLSLIRETTGANMFMNLLSTSWMLIPSANIISGWMIHTVPLLYNGCSCALSSRCVSPSRTMLAGCYALECILQSTLKCLYDQQCIDSTNTFQAMNMSSLSSSRFLMNVSVESIVNELMVEELLSNVSYELYYDECAPTSCTYSYVKSNNVIEGMTTLIGLYGGLVIICRLVAVFVVKLIVCKTQRVAPVTD